MKWKNVLLVMVLPFMLIGARPEMAAADEILPASDDAFVRDKDGQRDTNFDEHADELLATAEGFPEGVPVDIGYLRFDVSGVSGAILEAELRLYNQASPGPEVTVTLYSTADDD